MKEIHVLVIILIVYHNYDFNVDVVRVVALVSTYYHSLKH